MLKQHTEELIQYDPSVPEDLQNAAVGDSEEGETPQCGLVFLYSPKENSMYFVFTINVPAILRLAIFFLSLF